MTSPPRRRPTQSELVPAVVGIVGNLVTNPEQVADAAAWFAEFLDTAPPAYRRDLVHAACEVTLTLRDTAEDLVPGGLPSWSPEPLPQGAGEPEDVLLGTTDALRMANTTGRGFDENAWPQYADGSVSDDRLVSAVMTMCSLSATLVGDLARITGRPVKETWAIVARILRD